MDINKAMKRTIKKEVTIQLGVTIPLKTESLKLDPLIDPPCGITKPSIRRIKNIPQYRLNAELQIINFTQIKINTDRNNLIEKKNNLTEKQKQIYSDIVKTFDIDVFGSKYEQYYDEWQKLMIEEENINVQQRMLNIKKRKLSKLSFRIPKYVAVKRHRVGHKNLINHLEFFIDHII